TKYSSPFFNPGTGQQGTSAVTTHVAASYEVLSVRKIADLAATDAGHEAAAAGELAQRFQTAMATEADYYDVLANQELLRVATERLNRAREQLAVARARVTQGVAVQTDSLQVALEETRAEIDSARQAVSLAVARLQLGRRVGAPGPVAAQALDTLQAPPLPRSLEEGVRLALAGGPGFRIGRAHGGPARRDVTEAYETYTAARDNYALSIRALATAAENFRVQDQRYRGGAATILELVDAQVQLTQAGSDVVQTRYATRLALAGLEAI